MEPENNGFQTDFPFQKALIFRFHARPEQQRAGQG